MNNLHPILLKNVINKLIKSMMSAEIIYFKDSIWFIDREKQFWFFEFDAKAKHLWWRWSHFIGEFKIFSLDENGENVRHIFIELFSKVINRKKFIESKYKVNLLTVSDVMNFSIEDKEKIEDKPKVGTGTREVPRVGMDEVLNQEVETTMLVLDLRKRLVDEVLNQEVKTTGKGEGLQMIRLDEVLNQKVETTGSIESDLLLGVDEVLNQEVEMVTMKGGTECDFVREVLEVLPDPSNNEARVDGILKNT